MVVDVDGEIAVIVRLVERALAVAVLVEPGGMCLAPGRASESLVERRVNRAESGLNAAAALFASAQRTGAAIPR